MNQINTPAEDGFDFDDEMSFFGEQPNKQQEVITAVKASGADANTTEIEKVKSKGQEEADKNSDEFDFDFSTNEPEKVKAKTKEPEEAEEEVEEKDEEDDDKTKSKDSTKTKTTQSKEETQDDDEGEFFTTLAKEMQEKGILQNIELKDGEKLTEEQFFEFQNKEIEARVEETLDALSEKLKDPDAKAFFQHLQRGGTAKDYIQAVTTPINFEEIDVEDEAQREKVLRYYYTEVKKMDEDEVSDVIKGLKEGGKDKLSATKYIKIIQADQVENKKALELKTKADFEARRTQREEFNDSIIEAISKTEEVQGIKLSNPKKLGEFFTKPIIKVGGNTYVPAFQAKLGKILKAATPEDVNNLLLLGELLDTDFKAISKVKAKAETKVTNTVKSKLQETKKSIKTKTSASAQAHAATLADAFQE